MNVLVMEMLYRGRQERRRGLLVMLHGANRVTQLMFTYALSQPELPVKGQNVQTKVRTVVEFGPDRDHLLCLDQILFL